MTGHHLRAASIGAVVAFAATLALWWVRDDRPSPPRRVKQVIMSVRSGPQSLNWLTRHDATTYLVALLTQAPLVRINAATQEIEPWLAERWTRSDDGRRYRLMLRRDVRFSDGAPFTSDDVVFSFAAAFDPASTIADALTLKGQRIRAERIDAHTVDVIFPATYGPELRVLDVLPILPKHRLENALDTGTFGEAWSVSTPPADIVGLGPFVLTTHEAGVRLVFDRNPHYFRRDSDGRVLPRLDRLVLQILPDQEAQTLSLRAGENDGSASEIRPADYPLFKPMDEAGELRLLDLGTARNPDGLWINLKPGAFETDSRRVWLQRDELRQAISLGVDRTRFVDIVFNGAADPINGPLPPRSHSWAADLPPVPFDPELARARLASIGLEDRDSDGMLDDQGTRHARLTLITQKGQTALERGATNIRDQMKAIGLEIDVRMMEAGALIQQFLSGGGYDAVYFNLTTTDTDPASQLDFWKSDGAAHVWNLGPLHKTLAWEDDIDALMDRQVTSLDVKERKRLFGEVQRLFSEHAPIVYFAAPRVFVAVSRRLTGLNPAVSRPQLLWAADTLDVIQ